MADPRPYPGAPRWVKWSLIIVGVLTLFVVVLLRAGGGPHHNIPSGDASGQTPSSSVAKHGAQR
jgi:hypothetical protein